MKNKNVIRIILSFILIVIFTITATAHSTSQEGILGKTYHPTLGKYCIGGEDVGWSIDEGVHTNGTNITFSFSNDTDLTNTHKSNTLVGASYWNSVVTITHVSTGGTGTIGTEYNATSAAGIATFKNYTVDNNGHLTSWEIRINTYYNNKQSAKVMAHEFGHAIGLNDLYESQNSNKLMYGYETGTATQATSADVWGAKVITGQHVTHTWGYKFYERIGTVNKHIGYCTQCGGHETLAKKCTYNSNNICILCKTPKGSTTQSIEDEFLLI